MQRKWLEEYTDYLEQIEDLHEKRRKMPKVSDLVKGSSAEHPYTKQAMTISGADRQRADKIDQQIKVLVKRCQAVERFVDDIEDAKTQNIMRWRYMDGDGWKEIGQRMGKGEDAVRKRVERFLEKYFASCPECPICPK